jgi:hypothetical protein
VSDIRLQEVEITSCEHPGRGLYARYLRDRMDWDHLRALSIGQGCSDPYVIADQIKRISDANVLILWIPLHEAKGGWFWWR